jgi:hypothetical protein
LVEAEREPSVGIHVFIEEGGERAAVSFAELVEQLVLGDGPLDEERIDEHQAILQQLEAQGGDLLLGTAVGR